MKDFDIGKWFRGVFGRIIWLIAWVFRVVGGVCIVGGIITFNLKMLLIGGACALVLFILEPDVVW